MVEKMKNINKHFNKTKPFLFGALIVLGYAIFFWIVRVKNLNMSLFEELSIVLSSLAVYAVLWQMYALRKQLIIQLHQEYVRRYIEIIWKIPREALDDFEASLEFCQGKEPQFKTAARLYFWLIQEEYYEQEAGMVPHDQWAIWDQVFQNMMKRRCFREAWKELEAEGDYPEKFVKYVNRKLKREPL